MNDKSGQGISLVALKFLQNVILKEQNGTCSPNQN